MFGSSLRCGGEAHPAIADHAGRLPPPRSIRRRRPRRNRVTVFMSGGFARSYTMGSRDLEAEPVRAPPHRSRVAPPQRATYEVEDSSIARGSCDVYGCPYTPARPCGVRSCGASCMPSVSAGREPMLGMRRETLAAVVLFLGCRALLRAGGAASPRRCPRSTCTCTSFRTSSTPRRACGRAGRGCSGTRTRAAASRSSPTPPWACSTRRTSRSRCSTPIPRSMSS